MNEPSAPGAVEDCDVAVVGAGPAGLGAATRLRALGVQRVVVLEREEAAGGIPRHCGHYAFGLRELRRVLRGPDYARRLVAGTLEAGAVVRTGTTVIGVDPGPRLRLATADGVTALRAKRVILATGVRESSRAARLIGGQRPLGVVSTGALQGMVYLQGLAPFARPVILGTELVSFSAILTCRHAGIRPVAMIEENPRVTARSFARALPLALGVPVLLGTQVERIVGDARVRGVVVRGPDGTTRTIDCDGVIVSGRFTPEATLARSGHLAVDTGTGGPLVDQYGRCSDAHCFAAGNLLRPVETAGWSWREGVRTADWVTASLRAALPSGDAACSLAAGDENVRYVLPQRLVLPDDGSGLEHAQIRVSHPVRGRLVMSSNGRAIWSRRLSALPERRILVPLAALAGVAAGDDIRIGFETGDKSA